ncbi:MAG TPA: dTMP kinase [Solirubrobacterales bacterium]|nr:dTMP kinase [Solirubrobacterales bacterium]
MFITLEGVDGSGKTTQSELLVEALGSTTVRIREPGGTDAAERIRWLLADPETPLDPMAELLLFCAARADLVGQVIRPALDMGKTVVCDRFVDSTIAYQGVARGLGIVRVRDLNDAATDGLVPDLTLLLRVDPAKGLGRAQSDDRFEAEGLRFQEKVAEAYEDIARREPHRVVVIDGDGSPEEVHERVMAAVEPRLGN